MTEKHCKEFFGLFAAYLEADKNAAYGILINSVLMRRNERQRKWESAWMWMNSHLKWGTTSAAGYVIMHRMKQMLEKKRNRQMKWATERERQRERQYKPRETPGDEAWHCDSSNWTEAVSSKLPAKSPTQLQLFRSQEGVFLRSSDQRAFLLLFPLILFWHQLKLKKEHENVIHA